MKTKEESRAGRYLLLWIQPDTRDALHEWSRAEGISTAALIRRELHRAAVERVEGKEAKP